MSLPVKDFPALIRWLAERHHNGKVLPMAQPTGISPAMLSRWYHGQVTRPTLDTLVKLCRAYDLNVLDVLALLGVAPPPPTARKRPRRPVPIAGGSDAALPLPTAETVDDMLLIGSWWRRWLAGWHGPRVACHA